MITWTVALDSWTTYLSAIGTPDTTKSLRTYHVGRVARDIGKTPETLAFDDLIAWLAVQGWMPNTRRSYRQSLRSFYSWALATGLVQQSPAHLLPPVRVPRAKPRPTPEPIYRAALEHADDRVRLALRLGGAMGLRRSEMVRARREDLVDDLVGWSLRVHGKAGHERLVPAPADVVEAILERPAGWLFPNVQRGGPITGHHLAKLVSRELERHGPHSLRHRAGSVAYHETKDLRAVQEFLGHAKPETTSIYTLVHNDDVRAAMMAAAA